MRGRISRIIQPHKRGIAFITSAEANSVSVFLHRNELAFPAAFDDSLIGREVEFDLREGAKGLFAENVRPARQELRA